MAAAQINYLKRIKALEERATSAANDEDRKRFLLDAADICVTATRETKDPAQRALLRSKFEHFCSAVEEIKKSIETQSSKPQTVPTSEPSSLHPSSPAESSNTPSQTTSLTNSRLPSAINHQRVNSTRTLTNQERKLVLLSSRIGEAKFPPWIDEISDASFVLSPGELLYYEPHTLKLSKQQIAHFNSWKRASKESATSDSLLPAGLPSWSKHRVSNRADLVQDLAPDCSVVASLCAIQAREERGYPSLLSNVIYPWDKATNCPAISPSGKYIFCFNFNGSFRKVVIDDYLPTSKSNRKLHVVDRNNPNVLWPALLEKAYLKVRGGYEYPGSNSNTDLWVITGWIPEQVFLHSPTTDRPKLFRRILQAHRFGDVLVSMGTGEMSEECELAYGLTAHHNYVMLDMIERNDEHCVLLKNPWCEDTKQNTSFARMSITNDMTDNQPPGSFWITESEVCQNFDFIYLNWNTSLFKFREDIHFEWNLKETARNGKDFVQNPQFSISCPQGGIVWLLLNKHFHGQPALSDEDNLESESARLSGHIALYFFTSKGHRIYLNDGSHHDMSHYVDSPQVLLALEFHEPMTGTVVVSHQELLPITKTFSLIAFSSKPITLAPAKDRYAFSTTVSSKWTMFNAGGNETSHRFHKNPQFTLEVRETTHLTLLLSGPESFKVNAKLVWGGGKRVHTIGRNAVLLHTGPYSLGTVLARSILPVDPGRYTIIASTYNEGEEGSFDLRVDSDAAPVSLTQLPAHHAGKNVMSIGKVILGGRTRAMAAPLRPLRPVNISALTTFASAFWPGSAPAAGATAPGAATSPSSAAQRSPARITIQRGDGYGVRRVTSNEGEFSDATDRGLETPDVSVWPPSRPLWTDWWVILERQHGGTPGSEERFVVELAVEGVPEEGVGVGQWRGWEVD